MKNLFIIAFVIITYSCAIAQNYSNESTAVPDYKVSYSLGIKYSYIFIENKTTGKKTKVVFPDKERWLDQVWDMSPLPMFKLRTKTNFIGDTKYYLLFLNNDGSFRFVINPKTKNNLFDGIGECIFANGDYQIFDQFGEPIPDAYGYESSDCFSNIVKINLANSRTGTSEYYDKQFQKLKLTTQSKITAFDMDPYFIFFQSDSLYYFNYRENKMEASYPSLAEIASQKLNFTGNFKSEYETTFRIHKLFPVKVGNNQFAYINDKGEIAIDPFNADLALPFILPEGQAPVYFKNKWGIINKQGEYTVPLRLDSLNIGKNISEIEFNANDTIFYINKTTGQLQQKYFKINTVASNNMKQPEKHFGFACLIYILENPDKTYDNTAYILVSLGYDYNNKNHEMMSSWSRNAIQSEVSGLWERGYYRKNDSWNNPYQADIIEDGRSCYFFKSEYDQKSRYVSVIEKTFH
ncbi:MAG: hypothetical protein POELPBGB_02571 [Bacteroidia bacterium]|nr:hypothetical protein [Bacteroidia bacterium]